jgi:hypothetical protein
MVRRILIRVAKRETFLMPKNDGSTLFPLIKDTAGWIGEIASVVGIPGVGLVAKLVEKAPLEDVANYLKERASGRAKLAVPTHLLLAPEGAPPAPVPQQHQESPAPEAKAGAVELDIGTLRDEYARAEGMSEPILAALDEALAEAGNRLAAFIDETAVSSLIDPHDAYGLWPGFTLEWKVRRSLSDALAGTAAADEIPTVRTLVEGELAAGMIDYILAKAAGGPEASLVLGDGIRLFNANTGYRWSATDSLRTGYVIGIAPRNPDLLIRRRQDWAGNTVEAAQAAKTLVTRLGGLSTGGRDELTAAWLHSCAASEVPAKRRQERGVSINPFLRQIEYPLVHIGETDLRDALRPDVEAIYLRYDWQKEITADRRFFEALNELALAYRRNDEERFNDAAADLKVQLLVEKDSKTGVENVIKRLRAARGWDPA